MSNVQLAADLAKELVAPLGRRWDHVQAVAGRALELADSVPPDKRGTLVGAAWLHDIGYSPRIGHSRFHPLDGARFLRAEGWPEAMVVLVAHHSAARYEAQERGLTIELAEFPFAATDVLDALDTADLTTGPAGERFTFDERMDEIMDRYPPDSPVHRFWLIARPVEAEAVERTYRRLAGDQPK